MTTDEKAHIQTQVDRDTQTFLAAITTRAQKTHGTTLTEDEARQLVINTLAPRDKAPPQKTP